MMMQKRQLAAYRSSLDVEVETASPHKLILLLFDGGISAIRQAKLLVGNKERIGEKGKLIGKAIAIIEEGLRLGLDLEKGGELATNLDALYAYCSARLLDANLKNDVVILEEVEALLQDLRGAWATIAKPQELAGAGGSTGAV